MSPKLLRLSTALILSLTVATTAQATDLSGRWHGYWKSTTTGHQGPLNANFCRLDNCHYEVTFTGRFFKIFPFRYKVTLNVVADNGQTVTLRGSSYLGKLFGTFTYSATATECRFVSGYDSCRDDGKFVLCRR